MDFVTIFLDKQRFRAFTIIVDFNREAFHTEYAFCPVKIFD